MRNTAKSRKPPRIASLIRLRISNGGERLWRLDDFRELSFEAAAQALSRLTRDGLIERLSKGTYYRGRETAFGKSRPNPAAIQKLAAKNKPMFPAGIAAANLLGFSTQMAARAEIATCAFSLPRKLIGTETVIHSRRPAAWAKLSQTDAAILDFLRCGAATSELSPEATAQRTLKLLSEGGRFMRLLKIAGTEPPRVRALLGAIGEELGKNRKMLKELKQSLNPFSKFDFGLLSRLPRAHDWQAKERRRPIETV